MSRLILLTAACGVGKTTVKNTLNTLGLLPDFACLDVDEMGLNWWDYAGTPHESRYTQDCLEKALHKAGDKHLLFAACIAPSDLAASVILPPSVERVETVGLFCSDAEVRRRLLARPPERMCGDEVFIASQIAYNGWIRTHGELYDLLLDNTDRTMEETARTMAAFIRGEA